MIDASDFIERTRERGFDFWTGVPCSFLTPLIDCAIEHPALRWIGAANEGDAVATAAGAVLGGQRAVAMMQNSGLGNAVNPLASLTHTLRIPLLLIVTLRGDPELGDEPQHELMGAITERMLESLCIPSEAFPTEHAGIAPALDRACRYMDAERRPYALVLRKNGLAPHPHSLAIAAQPHRREPQFRRVPVAASPALSPTRTQALRRIVDATPEDRALVIATTGYTSRVLAAIADRANQLYMVGSMGCASSLGLGVSLACPASSVVVIDGDGAALMRMGNFATLGRYAGGNLVHVVLDNEMHESTGGQATVSGTISFAGIAAACGYSTAYEGDDLEVLDALFAARSPSGGPRFATLKLRSGGEQEPPRPKLAPDRVSARFADHARKLHGSGAPAGATR